MYLNNGNFKFEADPHQFNLRLHHFLQFQRKKICRFAGLWLGGEMVSRVEIYGSKVAESLSAFQRRSCSSHQLSRNRGAGGGGDGGGGLWGGWVIWWVTCDELIIAHWTFCSYSGTRVHCCKGTEFLNELQEINFFVRNRAVTDQMITWEIWMQGIVVILSLCVHPIKPYRWTEENWTASVRPNNICIFANTTLQILNIFQIQ